MAICNQNVLQGSVVISCVANIALGSFLILAGFSVTNNVSEFKAFIIPEKYYEAPYSSIVNGLCLYLTSIIGFCGIVKEKGFLLLLYSCMLGYLMLMGGLIMDKVQHENIGIQQDLEMSMYLTLQRFEENSEVGVAIFKGWSLLQKHLRCCGVLNYTDWIDAAERKPQWNITHPIPLSCCEYAVAGCSDELVRNKTIFTEGCLSKSLQHINLNKISQPLQPLMYIGTTGGILSLLLAWKWREN